MTKPTKIEAEGQAAAHKLEGAYKSGNDGDAYSKVMQEISRELRSFGGDKRASETYTGALTKQLEADGYLPRVSLYEAQREFVSLDPATAKKTIEAGMKGKNPVQQSLLKEAEGYYDQSRDGMKGRKATADGGDSQPQPIKWDQLSYKDQIKAAMTDVFSARSDGPSLYDRLRDDQGNIGPYAIKKMLEDPNARLSDDDRKALTVLKAQISNWSSTSNDFDRKQLEKLADYAGATIPPVEPVRKPESEPASVSYPAADKKGEQIKAALTIGSGGSYAQAAEGLLKLAGNDKYSGADIRHLAHLLWLADHKRKAKGLKSGAVLALSPEVVDNPLLAGLFRH